MNRWDPWRLGLLVLPKRLLTALAGRLCRSSLSRPLIPAFIWMYHIDYKEAEKPYQSYRSLTEFFSRRVKRATGRCDKETVESFIMSPADGHIAEVGQIESDQAIQAKGVYYSVSALLAENAMQFNLGTYITIYLSPADYHRIHVPVDASARRIVHVPGTLFPVNRLGVKHITSLFTRNERMITWFHKNAQPIAMVKVGSTIVGSVQLDREFGVNASLYQRSIGNPVVLWDGDRMMHQGDECAWFEFGSTVILLFPPQVAIFSVQKGDRIKALQIIGTWISPHCADEEDRELAGDGPT